MIELSMMVPIVLKHKERQVFSSTVTYGYLSDNRVAVKAYRGQVIEKSSILKCGPLRLSTSARRY